MLPSPPQRNARGEKPVALDFQATTPCAPEVVEAMEPWWQIQWGNPRAVSIGLGSWQPPRSVMPETGSLPA